MSNHADFFRLLDIPVGFDISMDALESAYFGQQRLFHPDRFSGKPSLERQAAMQRSMDINSAYNILKNPLSRAQYLLQSQGITVGTDHDTVKPSQALLVEIMELREAGIPKGIEDMVAESTRRVGQWYKDQSFEAMAQETLRLGYLLKMADEKV